jgi:hypothetical protein
MPLRRWRKVSPAVYEQTVASAAEDAPWYCRLNFDRPGASCDDPAEETGSPGVEEL